MKKGKFQHLIIDNNIKLIYPTSDKGYSKVTVVVREKNYQAFLIQTNSFINTYTLDHQTN